MEIPRREFLTRVLLPAAGVLGIAALNPSISFADCLRQLTPVVRMAQTMQNPMSFRDIGPIVPAPTDYGILDAGNGIRALYVSNDSRQMHVADDMQGQFFTTSDGGASWQQEFPFHGGLPHGIGRNYLDHNGNIMVVADNAISVLESDGWRAYIPKGYRDGGIMNMQTGLSLSNGRLLISGVGGVLYTDDLKSASYTKVQGLPPQGDIRALALDANTGDVYAGGWVFSDLKNIKCDNGTGLYRSSDGGKSFVPDKDFNNIHDARGSLPINTIQIFYYQGKKLMFIGSEGTGPLGDNKRIYRTEFPLAFIKVDDSLLSLDLVGNQSLAAALGGDFICPQKGFVLDSDTGRVFGSCWARGIAVADVGDLLNGNPLRWDRVYSSDPNDFGAGHLALDSSKELITGGQIWKKGAPPIGLRVSDL